MLTPIRKLHFLAQKQLYKSFFFTKWKSSKLNLSSPLVISFEQKLFSNYLMNPYIPSTPLWILSKCRVLAVRGSFLLLGTGRKYTQIQPKFKSVFEGVCLRLVNKDLIFGMFDQKFITFLKFGKLIEVLNSFYYCTLKFRLLLGEKRSHPFFVWQALVNRNMDQLFFYSVSFPFLFSFLQKKINFIQFNAFLKNAHWSFLINSKHAAIR